MAKDQIDLLLEQWKLERPDLDATPMGILGRLAIISRTLDHGVEQVLRRYGLSFPEFDMLVVLRRFGPPFRQPVSQLCAHSFLSSGAMTNRVDRLERKGLIQREPNPDDRRSVLVVLTKKGRSLIDKVVADRLEEGEERVSVLSKKDRQQLELLLTRFLAALSTGGEQ